jgi:hypothetical protein
MNTSKSGKDLSRRDVLRISATAAVATVVPWSGPGASELYAATTSTAQGAYTGVGALNVPPGSAFRRVTLEVSLKPFYKLELHAIREVCQEIFRSWAPLLRRCDGCAVMLWSADGSEILDYRGHMEDAFEWAKYLGDANPPKTPPADDPERKGTHARNWLYMENPPRFTYGWLRIIVATLKQVGREMTGKPVSVGATFDPGGEFAYSEFKFHRHPEIASGSARGANTWVTCTEKLKADTRSYAAFPNGIPEGTLFGIFFGRQSERFLTDLGFDYIWFSNGLGFSLSPWSVTGPLFDGKRFDSHRAPELREEILSFWRDFRKGCARFPIETRGSNMTVGADLSANGSPVLEIYRDGFGVVAPPNSPWAALDGDVGLEIIGYLSRIAELPPGNVFPFRFYTHDPWWLNSPWLDRYGRDPYDIFMPLALARLNGDAKVTPPAYLEFLTIDNSYGRMPEKVPNEVIPYILSAMEDYSDAPGLVTWIYPFDEYHEMTFGSSPRLADVFFGDWFLRDAVNNGFPLNSVVSTRQFAASYAKDPLFYRDTVLLAYAPVANGGLEKLLLGSLRRGQSVFLYGPVNDAGHELHSLLNLRQAEPVSGEVTLDLSLASDLIEHGQFPLDFLHRDLVSAGPIDTILADPGLSAVRVCAAVSQKGTQRVVAVSRRNALGGETGTLAWVRGSFCCSITEARLPQSDDPAQYFLGETLMRFMLQEFGYSIRLSKMLPANRSPLILAARHQNGFFLSCYSPDTTVTVRLRFPHGAPVLVGTETWIADGHSSYTPPRAWHKEVRCLVDQQESAVVACIEKISDYPFIERRLLLTGLKNATVHFYPENDRKVIMAVNDNRTYNLDSIPYVSEAHGKRLVAKGITGQLLISW